MSDKGLSQAQRETAIRLHGEDFVAALESDTNKMATVLESAGIQSKDDGSIGGKEIPEDVVLVEEIPATDAEVEAVLDAVGLAKSVADLVTKQLNPAGLQEAIKAVHVQGAENATAIANITKRLEALEKSDDEKLAKELTPRVAPGIDWMGGFRASQSKETVVTEQEKEKFDKAKPNESWVTDAFSLGG
jgi:hypothetical protein